MMHLRIRPPVPPEGDVTLLNAAARLKHDSQLDTNGHHGLLQTPIATLMERVKQRRIVERSLAMGNGANDAAIAALLEDDERDTQADDRKRLSSPQRGLLFGQSGPGGEQRTRSGTDGTLWVDKYAPANFRDLLSDERINREVLRAVKAWDSFVFKKEVR